MNTIEALSVTVTAGKKVPVVSIRFRGERPSFMPESFKSFLDEAGYSSSIHLSSGPATDCADDEFDVLTSPQMSGTPRMIAPAEINAALRQ